MSEHDGTDRAGRADPGDRRRARHPDPPRAVPVPRQRRADPQVVRSRARGARVADARTAPTRTTWRRSRARSAFSAWDKGAVRDSVDGAAEFTTQDGARWKVVLDRVQTKDVPHHPKFGGVIRGLYYHGATGVHTPLVPTINSAVALWSIAHLYRNGELVTDNAYVHVMLLSRTRRDKDFALACWDCSKNKIEELQLQITPGPGEPKFDAPGGFLFVNWERSSSRPGGELSRWQGREPRTTITVPHGRHRLPQTENEEHTHADSSTSCGGPDGRFRGLLGQQPHQPDQRRWWFGRRHRHWSAAATAVVAAAARAPALAATPAAARRRAGTSP